MHQLKLPNRKFKDAYLNKSVKTLYKGIGLNVSKDVDRACQLAILLYAAGFREDALSLVGSFSSLIKYSERSGAWMGKETAMSLVAYDHVLQGNLYEARQTLQDLFDSHPDLDPIDTDLAKELVQEDIDDYVPRSEWPEEIRHMRHNAVLGHSSQVLSMLFNFLVLLLFCEDSSNVAGRADEIVRQELQALADMYDESDS